MRRSRRGYKRIGTKPKWSCNMTTGSFGFAGPSEANSTVNAGLITQNNTRNSTNAGAAAASSASIVTAGRFEVRCTFGATTFSNYTNMELFICYVPEVAIGRLGAQTISNSLLFDASSGFLPYVHPEWILTWKKVTWYTTSSENPTFTLYSSKKRKLQPGDAIVIAAIMRSVSNSTGTNGPMVSFTARYWAKNN